MIIIAKGQFKPFNQYKICGDYTIIYLVKQDGRTFETYIDTEDLERIKALGVCWNAAWAKDIQDYYAKSCQYLGIFNGKPKYKIRYLHREIMNAPKGTTVDHKEHYEHSSLNNRKENLRLVERNNNSSNRSGANKNSSTGVRNVNYIEKLDEYWVQLMKKGERFKWIFPGDQFQEAVKFAEEKRKELFGNYAGNGQKLILH